MQENEFLQMQSAQYRIFRKNMEETRRARHDLRQHITVIQSCIGGKNWDELENISMTTLKICPLMLLAVIAKTMLWMPYFVIMQKRLLKHIQNLIFLFLWEKTQLFQNQSFVYFQVIFRKCARCVFVVGKRKNDKSCYGANCYLYVFYDN